MPPAASGISSSYLPKRVGIPDAVAAAGTDEDRFILRGSSQANAREPTNDLAHVRHVLTSRPDVERHEPASVMCDTRNVGAAVVLRSSRSFATASIRFRIWSKFAAIVT